MKFQNDLFAFSSILVSFYICDCEVQIILFCMFVCFCSLYEPSKNWELVSVCSFSFIILTYIDDVTESASPGPSFYLAYKLTLDYVLELVYFKSHKFIKFCLMDWSSSFHFWFLMRESLNCGVRTWLIETIYKQSNFEIPSSGSWVIFK